MMVRVQQAAAWTAHGKVTDSMISRQRKQKMVWATEVPPRWALNLWVAMKGSLTKPMLPILRHPALSNLPAPVVEPCRTALSRASFLIPWPTTTGSYLTTLTMKQSEAGSPLPRLSRLLRIKRERERARVSKMASQC
jgi:hypothetical protein